MSTVKNKETKKRTPRTKESKEPIMRVGPKSEVLEKKIVDVYIPPQPCWNPISVKSALDMHDRGNTQMSGRLADSITRDTRVRACLNTLVFGILGLPFEWKWDMAEIGDGGSLSLKNVYTPTEEDKRYLEITKRWFEDFKSTSILGSIMTNVINMGFAGMSISWVLESDY